MEIVDDSIKTVPVPTWFKKGYKALEPMEKRIAELFGIDHSYVEKRRRKMMESNKKGRKKILEAAMDTVKKQQKKDLTDKEDAELNILFKLLQHSMEILWLKFRLENISKEWVDRDMTYDFINQTIIIEDESKATIEEGSG